MRKLFCILVRVLKNRENEREETNESMYIGSNRSSRFKCNKISVKDAAEVTALVRDVDKVEIKHERLQIIEGNVLNENDIKKVIKGCDIVISALGTDGNGTLAKSMPNIIKHMEEEGVKKIITIGTAGILQARTNPSIYRFQSNESKRKTTTAAEDHLAAYKELSNSILCWTVVCPTHLIDGEVTGVYRTEKIYYQKVARKLQLVIQRILHGVCVIKHIRE